MKIKLTHIVLGFLFLFGTTVFGQQKYSDQEMGFDVERLTKRLEKRGYGGNEITNIILTERENATIMHEHMVEIEKEIKLKIKAKETSKTNNQRLAGNCIMDIPQAEKDALVALYNSTNGAGWDNNTGWLDFNACDWYGVTIQNGHVIGLDLNDNILDGNLPIELENLTMLKYLDLGNNNGNSGDNNNLTGSIPFILGNLIHLELIGFDGCYNLTANFQEQELTNLTALYSIDFNNVNLSGEIIIQENEWQKLTFLDLSRCDLTGNLSISPNSLNNIEFFWVGSNNLTGSIPSVFGNLITLVDLRLELNLLSGTIPVSLSQLTNLEVLLLNENDLFGEIPYQFESLQKNLTVLKLAYNLLVGEIPPELGGLSNLIALFLGGNNLTGNIPIELEQLNQLLALSFNSNDLSGNIPSFTDNPLNWFTFRDNKFRFVDFEDEFPLYYNDISALYYSPQALIDTEETIGVPQGSSYTFTMFTDNYYSSNNEYQWYKDGTAISGATNRTYTIANVTATDAGDYYCLANNTIVNGLTLQRHPIHLVIGGCDFKVTDINLGGGGCNTPYRVNDPDTGQANLDNLCSGISYCFSSTYALESSLISNIQWTLLHNNEIIETTSSSVYNLVYFTFPYEGSFNIEVEITLEDGCTSEFTNTFVVDDCDPCGNVALIIDESGSISEEEAQQIRNGLNRFIEDQLDSGMTVSLIGMSYSDTDLRTDHIKEKKIVSNSSPTNPNEKYVQDFYDWVADYGNRNETEDGVSGVSGSSDYWASALSVVNNDLERTPDIVIIFTDGSQTANVDGENGLISQINSVRTNSHLYVYGIDNEYYVNEDNSGARLSRDQDPNYTTKDSRSSYTADNSALRSVVSSLRTSLDYLFGNAVPEGVPLDGDFDFIIDNISNLENQDLFDFDYHGYEDFSALSTGLTVLSNVLAESGIDCANSLEKCYDCFTFQPEPGKLYWISGWAKKDLNIQVKSYYDPYPDPEESEGNVTINDVTINLIFIDALDNIISTLPYYPSGNIIDGWQRIVGKFEIPENTVTMELELSNNSPNVPVYFDDIRVHPINGSMKSFVYDPITYRLMAELDENNYSTFYEYDNEGGLIRVKKETSKGVKTIQETRSGNVIKNNN